MSGTQPTPRPANLDDARARWILLGAFLVSRLAYYVAGVRFDTTPLLSFFQIFDPELLRSRLLETLFYSHTQPPGFNFLIGAVLKLFPEHYAGALHLVYMICGLAVTLCVYSLMRALGVRPWVGVGLTLIFTISPGLVLFENLLIYEPLALALLCVAAVMFHRAFQTRERWPIWVFFGALLGLVMIRSVFHLGYLALAAAVLYVALADRRRVVASAAAIPLLLSFALYAKNWYLYDTFNSSTWMGFNIYTITTHQLKPEEREEFIQKGFISPLNRIETLENLSYYKDFVKIPPPSGIPVLDQVEDSTGRSNFNHRAYFQIHSVYKADGKWLLMNYPVVYVRSIVKAFFAFFLPASDFPPLAENRRAIAGWDRAFNRYVFGQWREATDRKELRQQEAAGASVFSFLQYTGVFLLIGLPALFFGGLYVWVDDWRKGRRDRASLALLAFLLFHVLMITALVNLLSSFETNRYRLPIDGFFVVLAGLMVDRLLRGGEVGERKERAKAAHV